MTVSSTTFSILNLSSFIWFLYQNCYVIASGVYFLNHKVGSGFNFFLKKEKKGKKKKKKDGDEKGGQGKKRKWKQKWYYCAHTKAI